MIQEKVKVFIVLETVYKNAGIRTQKLFWFWNDLGIDYLGG